MAKKRKTVAGKKAASDDATPEKAKRHTQAEIDRINRRPEHTSEHGKHTEVTAAAFMRMAKTCRNQAASFEVAAMGSSDGFYKAECNGAANALRNFGHILDEEAAGLRKQR